MNDKQRSLACELATHPNFKWLPGMAIVNKRKPERYEPLRVMRPYERQLNAKTTDLYLMCACISRVWPRRASANVPDLTDAATGGILWELAGRPPVSMVHGYLAVLEVGDPGEPTKCCAGLVGDTLGEACARLWLRQQAKAVVADSATTGAAPRGDTLKLYYANDDLPFHEQPFSELSAASAGDLAQEQANLAHCAIDWVVECSNGEVLDSGTVERWVTP